MISRERERLAAGHPAVVVGHDVEFAGAERRVRRVAAVELPACSAERAPPGLPHVLADRLVAVRPAGHLGCDLGELGQRDALGRRDVVDLPFVSGRRERERNHLRELRTVREAHAAVAAGLAGHVVLVEPPEHIVGVHPVANRRPRESRAPQHLLGRAVRTGVQEDRVGAGVDEREVHHLPDAGLLRRSDE